MKRLKKLQKHPESKKQELTVEKIIFETRVAGAGFYEALDFTWGEAIEFIKIYNERRKRENQDQAIIAFREINKYKNIMYRYVNNTKINK